MKDKFGPIDKYCKHGKDVIAIKKTISIFVIILMSIIIFIVLLSVFQYYKSFYGLKGEIMLMEGEAPSFPVLIYDIKNNKKYEIRNIFYDVQYDANNGNNLIAVIDNEIYKINEYQRTGFANRQLLYTGENVRYPKFVPDKNAISFTQKDKLTYYDLDTKKSIVIAKLLLPGYDWLDSDTVLFTDVDNSESLNIMAYKISNNKTYVFKKDAAYPSLSYNKKFLAYHRGNVRNVVYIEEINGSHRKSVRVNSIGLLPYKPSSDGNYLIGAMYYAGHADVVIINVTNNKIRKIFPGIFPSILDWKE
ncbi:hypothetical protein [Thermoanaerobacterium thermosaccharolyticum]|uniref:hypothetical protein n=1 Tax=Thermoanaerobacterium thermosaccharolyticum TaxID=1517 RepID=UPI003D296127